ncbi:MAG: NUDIX domain-containing protein [Candidatus Gracilibacteria bacterium]|nr:NUDIX domain-containing protein [Candidatus Gracilibacteria bacterium]
MEHFRPVASVVVSRGEGRKKEFLLVKKPRSRHAWQFPQGGVATEESHSTAAEREFHEECGSAAHITLVSRAPIGEYKYRFPAEFQKQHPGFAGAHVLFFPAEWQDGTIEIDGQEIVESRWCNAEEIRILVEPVYWRVVKSFVS